jgi:hypothetical protein
LYSTAFPPNMLVPPPPPPFFFLTILILPLNPSHYHISIFVLLLTFLSPLSPSFLPSFLPYVHPFRCLRSFLSCYGVVLAFATAAVDWRWRWWGGGHTQSCHVGFEASFFLMPPFFSFAHHSVRRTDHKCRSTPQVRHTHMRVARPRKNAQ